MTSATSEETPPAPTELQIGWRDGSGFTRSLQDLQQVASNQLTEAQVGGKLAGCHGVTVGTLFASLHHGEKMSRYVKGTFKAADGVETEDIPSKELAQGLIIHSDTSGTEELPAALGGPVRVVYPPGVAVQSAICGTPKPVNLKGVVRLNLRSTNGSGLACDDDSDSD